MARPGFPIEPLYSGFLPGSTTWRIYADHALAKAEFAFSGREAALDFFAVASELVTQTSYNVSFVLRAGRWVEVTVRPAGGFTLGDRELAAIVALERLVGDREAL